MDRRRIVQLISFSAVLSVYIGLRIWNLSSSCLWFDEIFSVHAAEHSWDSILNFISLDLIHPPLFYILLKLWIAVGGEGLLWLRTFPVVFSIAALIPFLLLCRELKLSVWTSILALFLIAVNGSLIKYAQEVRMYSMLMSLSLLSFWLVSKYVRSNTGLVILTVVNILLVYTHYFGWLVILSEIAAILASQKTKWRAAIAMFAVSAAAFLPWMISVLIAARTGSELGQNIGWMHRPGLTDLFTLLVNLIQPFYYSLTSIDPISNYRVSIPLSLITCAVLVRFLLSSRQADRGSYVLLIFLTVPVTVAFVMSWALPYSIWGTRHLIIAFVPFLILVAVAIDQLPAKTLTVSAVMLLILIIGYGFFGWIQRPTQVSAWCGFESLAKEINTEMPQQIIVFEDLAAYHLWFALRDSKSTRVVKVDGFPGMSEDPAYFLPRGFDGVSRVSVDAVDGGKMWVVYRASDFDNTAPPFNTLSDHGYRIKQQKVYDYEYTKLIALFIEK